MASGIVQRCGSNSTLIPIRQSPPLEARDTLFTAGVACAFYHLSCFVGDDLLSGLFTHRGRFSRLTARRIVH
jgi:hypothetical protein